MNKRPVEFGYHSLFEYLSPEAVKAQMTAEREQLAKYRALKLQMYKDWSDPEKRGEIMFGDMKYKDIKAEEEKSIAALKESFKEGDPEGEYAKIAVSTGKRIPQELKLIFNPHAVVEKLTRWQKLKRWLFGSR